MPVIRLMTPSSCPAKWSGKDDETGSWLGDKPGSTSRLERAGDPVDSETVRWVVCWVLLGKVPGSLSRFSVNSFSILVMRSASCDVF